MSDLPRTVSELTLDKMILAEAARGNFYVHARRRAFVDHGTAELGVYKRRVCRSGQRRSTQRKIAKHPDDEAALTADIRGALSSIANISTIASQ